MTGERVKLSTPQQEKEVLSRSRKDRHKPPYHFLASGMSMAAGNLLLAHPIISTPEAMAFILPYVPQLLRLLCTIEGFTLSIQSPEAISKSEYIATQITRKTLLADETLISLLKSKLIGDDTSQHDTTLATDILGNVEAKLAAGEDSVDRSERFRSRKPLWNILFRTPPPITWTSFFIILQHIRSKSFIDMDYGSAMPVDEEKCLHCFNCKSADHNPTNCTFSTLEGWYGDKATAKVEETAEFASSTRPQRPYKFERPREDRRGYRGRGAWGMGPLSYRDRR